MTQLSDSMLMSLIRDGATIILPKEVSHIETLEDSFKTSLLNRRRKKPSISVIPSPVPG